MHRLMICTFSAFSLLVAAQTQPITLSEQSYAGLRDRIAWTSEQAQWSQLPWAESIPQAMVEAQSSRKMVLLWQERGQPLGTASTHGVRMRQVIWKDPQINSLLSRFVLVAASADQRSSLTRTTADLLRSVPSGGSRPFEGLAVFNAQGQMVYSTPSLDAGQVAKGLSTVLAEQKPSMGSFGEWLERTMPQKRGEIVWRVISRDLGAAKFAESWHAGASNVAYLDPEKISALPKPADIERAPYWTKFPDALTTLLAERVLVDSVRGLALPFDAADIQKRDLRIQRTTEQSGVLSYRIVGKFTASAVGEWSLDGDSNKDVESQARGIDLEAIGRAKFDQASKRWTDIEVVFAGTRWGGSPFNARLGDTGAREIGFLLSQVSIPLKKSVPIIER